MEQKNLKAELSRGETRNLYLFYGEERFLVQHYTAEIEKTLNATKTIYDGNKVPVHEIIMSAETLPFMQTQKRVIQIRDSKLFTAERKAESEEISEYFSKIPPDTILLFTETEVDRRTRAYKKAAERGGVIEFTPLPQSDLVKWLTQLAKARGIAFPSASVLLRTCGSNMTNLYNEADKLMHYCAKKAEITPADIAEICTPTLEARIFDLTKAVGEGNAKTALKIYSDMLFLKESPFMILTMIIRQLRIILLCKCHAEKNTPRAQIAKELNIRDFVIPEALSHEKRFTAQELITALETCQKTDTKMKTGLITPETGVELLIISLST